MFHELTAGQLATLYKELDQGYTRAREVGYMDMVGCIHHIIELGNLRDDVGRVIALRDYQEEHRKHLREIDEMLSEKARREKG